ncbi:hypothetical protein WBJ53_30500 [Spirosoma sp. SC4-14]|uniref:hypothetical protein n=1 Tax=Spirosoma sp. SC4-14 TaxID=3128900 RepID=UPI0030D394F4
MKTQKLLGYVAALLLIIAVAGCGPAYYSTNRYGYGGRYNHHHHYNRYNHPAPPRPNGGYGRW